MTRMSFALRSASGLGITALKMKSKGTMLTFGLFELEEADFEFLNIYICIEGWGKKLNNITTLQDQ